MDFLHSPSSKHQFHHNKKRLSHDQVKLLERSFSSNNKLDPDSKLLLAKQLGIPARQVAIWYQNKRARWKTQSLELGYNVIQGKLETALAEKRRLEKDVERLKGELRKAHELLLTNLNNQTHVGAAAENYPVICSSGFSTASDQEGTVSSSSFQHDQVKELEDLYACLIGMQ